MSIELRHAAQIAKTLHRDPAVTMRFAPIDMGNPELLHPAELASLSCEAVALRRREFAAGRACAAMAMRDLGLPAAPVPMAADRSPVWPACIVGSISHSRNLAGAALAPRSNGLRAIGLDIEEAEPLDDALIEEVCTPREQGWLASQSAAQRGLLSKAIFSAKEAAYKCQYPLTHEMFGFERLEIDLRMDCERFSARLTDRVGEFDRGALFAGHIWFSGEHIVSLVTLNA
ncbi:4'-phosphopantetheinyl transferase superfamily protein [Corticibacterium sp. UT-5YL-CI-8]|nr:4'-phosphopantetheinyl transferase superfamily protein [Tianweitania sp. UT-5YL-CI-8]